MFKAGRHYGSDDEEGGNSEADVKMPVAIPIIVLVPIRDKKSWCMIPHEMALIKPALVRLADSANDCDDERINCTRQIASLNEKQSLVIAPAGWLHY